jgi:hypothetical protein
VLIVDWVMSLLTALDTFFFFADSFWCFLLPVFVLCFWPVSWIFSSFFILLQWFLQDVHHGNGTQEIFDQNKSVSCTICFVIQIILKEIKYVPFLETESKNFHTYPNEWATHFIVLEADLQFVFLLSFYQPHQFVFEME